MFQHLSETSVQFCIGLGATAVILACLRYAFQRRQILSGKVVVITGGSSGIGEALGHEFVKAGSKVVLVARSEDRLKSVKEAICEIHKVGDGAVATFCLDLEQHKSISEGAKEILHRFGRVDVLVNNAGVSCRSKVESTELETYKKVFDLNFFGQVELTKAFLPSMISNGGGSIVAISSLQGKFAIPTSSAYGASKHALQAFCDSLRAENSQHNIHVLVVSPGYVKTNLAQSTLRGDGEKLGRKRVEIESGMSAEFCAAQVVQAVKFCKTELLIGPLHHRLLVYIKTLFPNIYQNIMAYMFNKNYFT